MKRRLVLATCLLGVIGAGAGAAFAATPSAPGYKHQLCVVTSTDDNHAHTQDYCVSWDALP